MVFKILLPVMVGFLVYLLGKSHARRDQRRQRQPLSVQAPQPAMTERFHAKFRLVAYLLVGSAILSAGWLVYEDWHASRKVVLIRVINAQTGESTTYQALHGQIHGRIFATTDGRQIRLADVERMEVGAGRE